MVHNGRFNIGDKICTAGFAYGEGNSRQVIFWWLPYMQTFTGILIPSSVRTKLVELTVLEHHRVCSHWSDTPDADGYILADTEGNIWYNQYPVAHYGQIDDKMDRAFTRKELYATEGYNLLERNGVCRTYEIGSLYENLNTLLGAYSGRRALKAVNGADYTEEKIAIAGITDILQDISRELGRRGYDLLHEFLCFRNASNNGITRTEISKFSATKSH